MAMRFVIAVMNAMSRFATPVVVSNESNVAMIKVANQSAVQLRRWMHPDVAINTDHAVDQPGDDPEIVRDNKD